MDVFPRLYYILRSISACGYSDRAFSVGEGWDATEAPYTAGQTQPPESSQDLLLAGYYANLDLPYGADAAAVKVAWRVLMKKYHPDRHAQDGDKRELANELCAELTRAYRELEQALAVT